MKTSSDSRMRGREGNTTERMGAATVGGEGTQRYAEMSAAIPAPMDATRQESKSRGEGEESIGGEGRWKEWLARM